MSAVLELNGLSFEYQADSGDTVTALRNIDLAVKHGEFVAIVGPTGCGKTTLLNLIAGLICPAQGVVLRDASAEGGGVPCVFQHYTLFPWRTVLRNVTFGLEMRGLDRRERNKVGEELLVDVGLSGFERAYPHELSGGMRQRAAIAQALAIDPSLLLMDEPFGALDDTTRRELQRMVRRLWQKRRQGERPMTVLFVTHNVDEAIIMGSRVIVLSDRPGRIVHDLAVDLERPRDRHSDAFKSLFLRIHDALPLSE